MEGISTRGGPRGDLGREKGKIGHGGAHPRAVGEVTACGGVARMREASKGGADGGRERCSTRGAARRLEKAAPEAAP